MRAPENFFANLNQSLKTHECAFPCLVVDLDALDHNISLIKASQTRGFDVRLVAKSLPCPSLIDYITKATGITRIMSFHLPFLCQLIENFPEMDFLLGKPMPTSALKRFNAWRKADAPQNFVPQDQLHWLIDSQNRLDQYAGFAEQSREPLSICLEIDIGLHRGGFSPNKAFENAIKQIQSHPYLKLSGLMGYEAHLAKIPEAFGIKQHFRQRSRRIYQQCRSIISGQGMEPEGLILNSGGSQTFTEFESQETENELAIGSALLKPSDFDLNSLKNFQPACWIATPVLKEQSSQLPGASTISALLKATGIIGNHAGFIYGGNWQAQPVYPQSMQRMRPFGFSSNQECYTFKQGDYPKVDDFVFFRPKQSEALLLQFGNIAAYRSGQIKNWWPVLGYPQSLYSVQP